jgi:hypothetical protein
MLTMPKQIAELLNRKKRPDDPRATGAALAAAEGALTEAETSLVSEQARHDDRAVAALAAGDRSGVELAARDLSAAHERARLARVTLEAVRRRHAAALAASEAAALATRWAVARAAADRRREALARLDALLPEVAQALRDANAATGETIAAVPITGRRAPGGWSSGDLESILLVRLAALTGNLVRSRTLLSDGQLAAQPGFTARHDASVGVLLASATDGPHAPEAA